MEQWKEYKYTELANIIGGGTPKTAIKEYWNGNIPWLSVKDFGNDDKYVYTTEKTITELGLSNSSTNLLQKEDIIISARGTVGELAMIPFPMSFNQSCFGIRAKENVNPHFLYYLTKTKIKELKNNSHGSVFDTITRATFENIICNVPKLDEQKRIADFLSSLDDKIEINRQINDNLEQQAQALFKSWFVYNVDSKWLEIPLSYIADFYGGYSYKGNELVNDSNTAMATIKNFDRTGGFKLDGYKPIEPSAKLKQEHKAELFDILVAHTDLTQNAEVIGNAEQILSLGSFSEIIYSMDLVKVVPKAEFPYKFLLLALLKNRFFKSHCLGYVNGTTVLHLSKKALPDYNVYKPTEEQAKSMNAIFESLYTKIAQHLIEIERLENLRDTLLPRLMSGELKINEINC